MSDIPEAIKKELLAVNLDRKAACWEVRSGTWAVKHFACERIAARLGITFDSPVPLHVSPDFVALSVTGRLGDASEWSVGEASASTSHNKYYCAMAEKRAKDRVILKLIGVHGQVYAEDEADSFTEQGKKVEDLSGELDALMAHNDAVMKNWASISKAKVYIRDGDLDSAAEAIYELDNQTTAILDRAMTKGGVFSASERESCFKPHGEVRRLVAAMKKADRG